jgi:hypothetical protein
MLMMKERRHALRTIEGWVRSVLLEAGAIRECEEHGWMRDRADPHAREPFSSLAGIRRPVSLRTRRSPLFATCWIRSATPARSARPTPLRRRSHQRAADEPSPPSI